MTIFQSTLIGYWHCRQCHNCVSCCAKCGTQMMAKRTSEMPEGPVIFTLQCECDLLQMLTVAGYPPGPFPGPCQPLSEQLMEHLERSLSLETEEPELPPHQPKAPKPPRPTRETMASRLKRPRVAEAKPAAEERKSIDEWTELGQLPASLFGVDKPFIEEALRAANCTTEDGTPLLFLWELNFLASRVEAALRRFDAGERPFTT